MSLRILREIRAAFRHLNPETVRQLAERPVHVGLDAASDERMAAMEEFFVPADVSRRKSAESRQFLHRVAGPGATRSFDIVVCDEALPGGPGAVLFQFSDPQRTVREVLRRHEALAVPLARRFPPFRKPAVDKIIRDVSRMNTYFALFSALPNVLPSIVGLIWAPMEFASDTAVITANQVRMAFLIAAASDKEAGYFEQKGQIASIIAGAFGWRALARELAGKVPLGGGLMAKAAIAYAGTFAVGRSLERFHRIGYGLTREEQEAVYRQAFERGKRIAESIWKRKQPAAAAVEGEV